MVNKIVIGLSVHFSYSVRIMRNMHKRDVCRQVIKDESFASHESLWIRGLMTLSMCLLRTLSVRKLRTMLCRKQCFEYCKDGKDHKVDTVVIGL